MFVGLLIMVGPLVTGIVLLCRAKRNRIGGDLARTLQVLLPLVLVHVYLHTQTGNPFGGVVLALVYYLSILLLCLACVVCCETGKPPLALNILYALGVCVLQTWQAGRMLRQDGQPVLVLFVFLWMYTGVVAVHATGALRAKE